MTIDQYICRQARAAFAVAGILATAAVLSLPVLQPASAASPFDGTYHGSLKGDDGNAVRCAKGAPVQITVTNGQLEYHHFSNAVITTPVAADGSFSGSARNNQYVGRSEILVQTLTGKITGTAIQAETKVGNYCTYQMQLTKFQ
jgi:hypothetical protein